MVEELLRKVDSEIESALRERRYLWFIGGDYCSGPEPMGKNISAGRRKTLTDGVMSQWNHKVDDANRLIKQISLLYRLVREEDQSYSHYKSTFKILWNKYTHVIVSLMELDPDNIAHFKDRTVARVSELETRINDLCNDWDSHYSEYLERMVACYEQTHDLMVTLTESSALLNAREVTHNIIAGTVVTRMEAGELLPQDHFQPKSIQKCRCGSIDFWLRPTSQWGCAEWVCSRCHPKPGARIAR